MTAGDGWWDQLRAGWMPDDSIEPTESRKRYYEAKRAVVRTLEPGLIAEIGVRAGYSAFAMLSAHPSARYWGIDKDDGTHGGVCGAHEHARKLLAAFDAEIMIGDSHRLSALPPGIDLLHIDGDHSYEGCSADLRLAERSGVCWALVDDTDYIPEVRRAVEDFTEDARWIDDGHRGMALVGLA